MDREMFQNTDTNIYQPQTPLAKKQKNKNKNKKEKKKKTATKNNSMKTLKFMGMVQRIDEF